MRSLEADIEWTPVDETGLSEDEAYALLAGLDTGTTEPSPPVVAAAHYHWQDVVERLCRSYTWKS